MTKQLKSTLRLMGTVVNLLPDTDYQRFVPKENPKELFNSHWENTGKYLQKAVNTYSDETERK